MKRVLDGEHAGIPQGQNIMFEFALQPLYDGARWQKCSTINFTKKDEKCSRGPLHMDNPTLDSVL